MDRIVVGVNGSPASTAAAVWAAGEAAMRNIELTIVHVLAASSTTCTQTEWPAKPLPDEATNAVVAQGAKAIDHALDAVAKESRHQPPRITSTLCFGPVVPTLWEFTQEGAQMIVLGRHSRGTTRRAGPGSVTDEMLQSARCPVMVVPADPFRRAQPSRAPVVVGCDSAPTCELATAIAFDEAARRTVELVAVQAVPCADSSAETQAHGKALHFETQYVLAHTLADWQQRYPNVVVRCLVTPDDPVQALLKNSRDAQLVVVGGSRHGSFVANSFGGVSSAVAQASRIPVIVARGKPARQPETIGDRRKNHGPGAVH